MSEIDILNKEYTIKFKNEYEDEKLYEMEGYTDTYKKEIIICNLKSREAFKKEDEIKIKKISNKILRHEIIHAFLFESGLDCNSNRSYAWAENEEMVDWFAIQSPKIFKIFKNLQILEED